MNEAETIAELIDPKVKEAGWGKVEGDIGKRLDILGGREKWLVNALNNDRSIIKEIMTELISVEFPFVKSMKLIEEKMKKYKFSNELIKEVSRNFRNLVVDLKSEGVEFD